LARSDPNCWPAYYDEWADLLAQFGDGADAIEQTWRKRNHVRTLPSAKEISAMDRTLEWPGQYLRREPVHLVYALNAVGLARAREVELKDIIRRGKRAGVNSPAVWQQLALEAAGTIARGLRVDQIPVF
jgi:hypothetical protein